MPCFECGYRKLRRKQKIVCLMQLAHAPGKGFARPLQFAVGKRVDAESRLRERSFSFIGSMASASATAQSGCMIAIGSSSLRSMSSTVAPSDSNTFAPASTLSATSGSTRA